MRGNYKSYPVSRTTSEERAERSRGWGWRGERGGERGERVSPTSGRMDVGVCYTRGAMSRRWCGWWGRRGR